MIKHIVMWKVAGETQEEKLESIQKVKSAFDGIADVVPGLTRVEIGVDVSRIDYACDVVLYSEFESQAALDNYITHPAHLKLKEDLAGVRVARYQVDYVADRAA
ncbi:Dabb family protein [Paraburkholderia oxyphila]|uniref:Dabb family protein n=1 Tax=Paraburkholderia oxyphila TaxID=614212 RepID=UPI0004807BFC|nr:Dabb family protein [Paraburkholderia oxyphila]